jgi:hypothetical protein
MSGMQMMLLGTGGVADVVNFVDVGVYAVNTGAAVAGYRVSNDSFDYQGVNGTYTVLAQWVTPSSAASSYEIFATVISGAVSSGTIGSWVATSGNPTWTRNQVVVGSSIVELSMQVRAVGSVTVLDTWSVALEAER